MTTYEVVGCPTNELSYTNRVTINSRDRFAQIEHVLVSLSNAREPFVFSTIQSDKVSPGQIAFNLAARKWASLQTGAKVQINPYKFENTQYLAQIVFYTDYASKKNSNDTIDTNQMSKQFSLTFINQAFTVGQLVGFCFQKEDGKNVILELKVKELKPIQYGDESNSPIEIGLTTGNTIAIFEKAKNAQINLVGSATQGAMAPQIFNPTWDLEAMGIGGLDKEFEKLFTRAFLSRLFPVDVAKELGLRHVKGVLLYGPPGTGKTLLAREIGKMLHAREPKIVNGPEIFNKYVGESEANIRKLFEDAVKEEKAAGIHSGLHMIIFDEIDAICKARSATSSSAGAGDNVLNQLLTMIDGVNALNNILVIGMTNRKDLIDEALLRPGRFEIQLEIGLPDEKGRLDILRIHTRELRKSGKLSSDVNLEELAHLTKNFSGAEISGLVATGFSLASKKLLKTEKGTKLDTELLKTFQVSHQDFVLALDHIRPAFGGSDDLKLFKNPVIRYNKAMESLLDQFASYVEVLKAGVAENAGHGLIKTILLTGESHSGLTSLAVEMANSTNFPLIRLYDTYFFAGNPENRKVEMLRKIFSDASKSQLSCIVIDNIDRMLDYIRHGPRFSIQCLMTLIGCIDHPIPKDRGILLICTLTEESLLKDLNLNSIFRKKLEVPLITDPLDLERILVQEGFLSTQEWNEIDRTLEPFKIGIKDLMELANSTKILEPSRRVAYFKQSMLNFQINTP